jgi:hypothetical protein
MMEKYVISKLKLIKNFFWVNMETNPRLWLFGIQIKLNECDHHNCCIVKEVKSNVKFN